MQANSKCVHMYVYMYFLYVSLLNRSCPRIKRAFAFELQDKKKKMGGRNHIHNKLEIGTSQSLLVYPCLLSAVSRLPSPNQSSYCVLPLKQQPGFPLRLSVLSEPTSFRKIISPFYIWKCTARSNNTISNWCWGKCSISLEKKQQQIKKTKQIMFSIRKCQHQNL